MFDRWIEIISSPRFQQVALGSLSLYLADVAANGYSLSRLLVTISGFLGIVATIGTVDSAAEKLSSKKAQ